MLKEVNLSPGAKAINVFESHNEGQVAVGVTALHPEVQGLPPLHHNAWKQGMAMHIFNLPHVIR